MEGCIHLDPSESREVGQDSARVAKGDKGQAPGTQGMHSVRLT